MDARPVADPELDGLELQEMVGRNVHDITLRPSSRGMVNHIRRSTPFVRQIPKVGRNTKCICGSGKKVKHCTCRFSKALL